jgi:hypothetical protein
VVTRTGPGLGAFCRLLRKPQSRPLVGVCNFPTAAMPGASGWPRQISSLGWVYVASSSAWGWFGPLHPCAGILRHFITLIVPFHSCLAPDGKRRHILWSIMCGLTARTERTHVCTSSDAACEGGRQEGSARSAPRRTARFAYSSGVCASRLGRGDGYINLPPGFFWSLFFSIAIS